MDALARCVVIVVFNSYYFVRDIRTKITSTNARACAMHVRVSKPEKKITEQNEKLKDNILFWCTTTTTQLNDYCVLRGFVYLLFSLIK